MEEVWSKLWDCNDCNFHHERQKIFYGYGNAESAIHSQKVMFLFMNPGGNTKEMELQFIKSLPDFETKIQYCRVDLLPWLDKHHKVFKLILNRLTKHKKH